MKLTELERLAKLCHKYKIKSYSAEGVSLTFSEHLPDPKAPAIESAKMEETTPEFTEEQILLWSSQS